MEDTIGIDISKDKLDAYWLSKEEHKQFCNDKAGVKALALWANEAGVSRVIFESTDVYHRVIETGLADHDISRAEGKTIIRPNGITDDLSRKTVAFQAWHVGWDFHARFLR